MPKLLDITPEQRRKIHRLYLAGHGPAEIAKALAATGVQMSQKQISNLSIREKWTREKHQVDEAKHKTVSQALENVRASMAADVEEILLAVVADMKKDGESLKAGEMNLAVDAAGVSAVQRGKKLFVDRVFRLAGLDVRPDASIAHVNAFAMIFGRPIGEAAPTPSATVDINAEELDEDESGETNLEFI